MRIDGGPKLPAKFTESQSLKQRALNYMKQTQVDLRRPDADYKELLTRTQTFTEASTAKSLTSETVMHDTLKEISIDNHAQINKMWNNPNPDPVTRDAVLRATLALHDNFQMQFQDNKSLFTKVDSGFKEPDGGYETKVPAESKFIKWMGDMFKALETHPVLGPAWLAILQKEGRTDVMAPPPPPPDTAPHSSTGPKTTADGHTVVVDHAAISIATVDPKALIPDPTPTGPSDARTEFYKAIGVTDGKQETALQKFATLDVGDQRTSLETFGGTLNPSNSEDIEFFKELYQSAKGDKTLWLQRLDQNHSPLHERLKAWGLVLPLPTPPSE